MTTIVTATTETRSTLYTCRYERGRPARLCKPGHPTIYLLLIYISFVGSSSPSFAMLILPFWICFKVINKCYFFLNYSALILLLIVFQNLVPDIYNSLKQLV